MVTGNPNAAPGRSRPAPRATSGRRGMSCGFALMPASVFPAGLFCAERLTAPAATAETRPHAGRSGRVEKDSPANGTSATITELMSGS